jgi:hypothetical protein
VNHRALKSILLAVALVAVAGCRTGREPTPAAPSGDGMADPLAEEHGCLPGFHMPADLMRMALEERTGEWGRGWARRVVEFRDFEALDELCNGLAVALDNDVAVRSHAPGKFQAPPDTWRVCTRLRCILQNDRAPGNHLWPRDPGWLTRDVSYPDTVEQAEDLYGAARDALDR